MSLPTKPPAYTGYQPVSPTIELEDADIEPQDADLERNQPRHGYRDEDECCMTTRMCLPYLFRLSMTAIIGGTILGVTYFATHK